MTKSFFLISSYEKNYRKNKRLITTLNTENQFFREKFEKFKNNPSKKRSETEATQLNKKFETLINEYQRQGYKIPDFAEKTNLFEETPELIEDRKLLHLLNLTENPDFDKSCLYVKKLAILTNDKLNGKADVPDYSIQIDTIKKNIATMSYENKQLKNLIDEAQEEDYFLETAGNLATLDTGGFKETIQSSKGHQTRNKFSTLSSFREIESKQTTNFARKLVEKMRNKETTNTFERTQVNAFEPPIEHRSDTFKRFVRTFGRRMAEETLRKIKKEMLTNMYQNACNTHFSENNDDLEGYLKSYNTFLGEKIDSGAFLCYIKKKRRVSGRDGDY